MISQTISTTEHHDVCTWWKAYTFDNPIRKLLHKPQSVLGVYVKGGMTVTDVGCGMGHFSIGMAKLVGESGKVIAIDLQQKMLDVMLKRAKRAGVAERIFPYRCESNNIGKVEHADFILAFWMVHEVDDKGAFFTQLKSHLKPKGKILIAEPKMHVNSEEFEKTIETAQSSGLRCCGKPSIRFSIAALFETL
jgi:2-polyprenyl-3-methyl-5-hydroxy-6-metoxy-1,4-benzoquinol methylase